MRPTLRNRASRTWMTHSQANQQFLGLADFCNFLDKWFCQYQKQTPPFTAVEIGSHMGEGLQMLAATHLFNKIHVIEPFKGEEAFNTDFKWTWEEVRQEWDLNTRHFKDIIQLHEAFSYEVVDKFFDNSINLVYIDGDHSYEAVKRDIELYLPKIRNRGILSGHDYHTTWPGVMKAVNETLGTPDKVFQDSSWMKIIKTK